MCVLTQGVMPREPVRMPRVRAREHAGKDPEEDRCKNLDSKSHTHVCAGNMKIAVHARFLPFVFTSSGILVRR
jgi:hypothetical protein